MAQTQLFTPNEEKLKRLTQASFDLLWTGLHDQSEFHYKFVVNALGDAIYKFAPRLFSGLISQKAQEALQDGQLIRSQLCKEHPKPRQDTAVDLINTFVYHYESGSSNTVIKEELGSILAEGSRVNLVLSEENTALVPFQKQGLDADQCYMLANIILVPDRPKDPPAVYHVNGKTYNTQPEVARDLNISITTVRRRIKQGLIAVERKAA